MIKRHQPAAHNSPVDSTPAVGFSGPKPSAQQLKRAAKIRREIDALKKKLAQVLGQPSE
jgi:hypothetical protein